MKVFLLSSLFITISFISLIGNQSKASTHEKMLQNIHLVLLDTRPYTFKDKSGNKTGYFHDAAKRITHGISKKTELTIASPQRIVRDLPRGNFDCIIAVNSEFIKNNFTFIADTGLVLDVGILPHHQKVLSDYNDLSDMKIAVVKGTTFDPKFDSDDQISKILTPNYSSSIKMLNALRVDGAGGALSSLKYSAKQAGISMNNFGKPLIFNTLNVWFSCNNDFADQNDLSPIRKRVVELRDNGVLMAIQESYLK